MKKQGKRKQKSGKRIELSSKEFRINLEQLQRDVTQAYDSMRKMVPQGIKNLEVKKFGNAAHIILPKEFAGKKASVFIKRG